MPYRDHFALTQIDDLFGIDGNLFFQSYRVIRDTPMFDIDFAIFLIFS